MTPYIGKKGNSTYELKGVSLYKQFVKQLTRLASETKTCS